MPKVQYPTIQGKKRLTSFTAPWIGIKEKGVFPPMNHWYLKDNPSAPELPLLFWKENSHWQGNSSEGCTMKAFSKEYPGGILSAHWFTRNLIVEAVYKAFMWVLCIFFSKQKIQVLCILNVNREYKSLLLVQQLPDASSTSHNSHPSLMHNPVWGGYLLASSCSSGVSSTIK